MKIFICVLVYVNILFQIVLGQTFRAGFDKRDFSSSGGNGQGQSYHANVKADIHNVETVYLKGYINMFQATHDKKYLDQFIFQPKSDSSKINEVSLSLIGGLNFTRPTYGIEDVQEGGWRYHLRLGCHYQFHKNSVINFNLVYDKLRHSETLTKNYNGIPYQGENIYTYELVGLESLFGWCSNRAVANYYFEFGPGVFTLISNSRVQTIPPASKYSIFYNSTLLLTSNIGSGLTINPKDGVFGINFSINYRFCLTGAKYDWTAMGAPGMAENKFQFFDFGLGLRYKL